MCAPVIAALQIASAVGSVIAQKSAADAQTASNQRQYENTMSAYRANINQTNLMQQQEREASIQKLESNDITARAAASKARVSAGENGISGLSVDALLGDISMKENRFDSSVATNYDRAEGAIRNQRENVYANAASTINSLQTPAMPDYLGAGLKIGSAVSAYDKTQNNKWFG